MVEESMVEEVHRLRAKNQKLREALVQQVERWMVAEESFSDLLVKTAYKGDLTRIGTYAQRKKEWRERAEIWVRSFIDNTLAQIAGANPGPVCASCGQVFHEGDVFLAQEVPFNVNGPFYCRACGRPKKRGG